MSNDHKPGTKTLSAEGIEGAKAETIHGTGYRRPPQHSQFKKGQSGNPKGRPKANQLLLSAPASVDLTLKEARRMVTVREGDKVHQIPAIEAVIRAQYASAIKGNAYSQKHALEDHRRAEMTRRAEIRENNELWRGYVRAERDKHAHAMRNGLPMPPSLPHPEDVVIDPEHGVRFIGPWDEEALDRMKQTLVMRDILIMQDAFQRRDDEPQPNHEGSTALVCAMQLDQSVPQRHRLSELEWISRMSQLRCVPKRELRKRLARGWATLGVEWTPYLRLPSLSHFTATLEQVTEAYVELDRAPGG